MRDRVSIMLGNREIVKRYIGDKLVWESLKSLKSVTIKKVTLAFYEEHLIFGFNGYRLWVSNRDIKTTLGNKKITKVRIGTSEFPLITTDPTSMTETSYTFYLSSETFENFKRVGVTTGFLRCGVTFYYE